MVQVARFGMFVVVTGDIPDPNVGGKHRKLAALTVVQQINFHLIRWIINALRGQHRIANHLERLVIAGDINIDRRPGAHIVR